MGLDRAVVPGVAIAGGPGLCRAGLAVPACRRLLPMGQAPGGRSLGMVHRFHVPGLCAGLVNHRGLFGRVLAVAVFHRLTAFRQRPGVQWCSVVAAGSWGESVRDQPAQVFRQCRHHRRGDCLHRHRRIAAVVLPQPFAVAGV
ncbi:hypothetical protein D3C76_974920 [compost metagenome]